MGDVICRSDQKQYLIQRAIDSYSSSFPVSIILLTMKFAVISVALLQGATAFAPLAIHRSPRDSVKLSASKDTPNDACELTDRRSLLLQSLVGTAAAASFATTSFARSSWADDASSSSVDYKAVSRDIAALIQKNPDWGPTMVRLAWHSSGTYDKATKTGGSGGGTIRFPKELAHGGNAGLASTAVEWLEPLHAKYADGLSYADLYTLAGGTFYCLLCAVAPVKLSCQLTCFQQKIPS